MEDWTLQRTLVRFYSAAELVGGDPVDASLMADHVPPQPEEAPLVAVEVAP